MIFSFFLIQKAILVFCLDVASFVREVDESLSESRPTKMTHRFSYFFRKSSLGKFIINYRISLRVFDELFRTYFEKIFKIENFPKKFSIWYVLNFFIFEFVAVWRIFIEYIVQLILFSREMNHKTWLIFLDSSQTAKDHSFVASSMIEIPFDASAPLIFPKTVISLLSGAIVEKVNPFISLAEASDWLKPIIASGELFALVFKAWVGVWSIFGAIEVFKRF